MARLLVTGATGLIGSELVRQAVAAGHELSVICRTQRLVEGARVIVADLQVPESLAGRLAAETFDAVIYLAQAADHNAFPANASGAVAINIAAPVALCQWAVQAGCRRFIFGSSGGICGASGDPTLRIGEDWPRQPTDRLSFYLATKARCEELLLAFRDQMQIDVLRYFFVYGKAQRPDFLLPRLARKIRAGEPIELAAGIGPSLNPIHAADAAALTLAALTATESAITNVAGLQDVTLREVIAQLERVLDREALVHHASGPSPSFLADTGRMLDRLGTPTMRLAEGIDLSFTPEEARA